MARVELPPPVHILLAYAADGWAVEQGRFNSSGKPKQPDASTWLSLARVMLREVDGIDRLRHLATAGMTAWDVDPSITACVATAFATPDFGARLAWRLGLRDYMGPRPAQVPPTEPTAAVSATSTSSASRKPQMPRPKPS